MRWNRWLCSALTGALLMQFVGCASTYRSLEDKFYGTGDIYSNPNVVVYRGGKRIEPSPLALNDGYAYTLLDKWRISHAWLGGPVGINYCRYSRRDNGRGADRFFETDGKLFVERVSGAKDSFGQKFISSSAQGFVYGIDTRTGEFIGYSPFCTHTFLDIWTGVAVSLIKPDSQRGTDKWIAGAEPIKINELIWLKQSLPIKEEKEANRLKSSLIERWVLQIPQTPYWIVVVLSGTRSSDGKGVGIDRNPEKFSKVQGLVHEMISSFRIDPIDAPLPTLTPPRPINKGDTVKG